MHEEHLGHNGFLYIPDTKSHRKIIQEQRLLPVSCLRECLEKLSQYGNFTLDGDYKTYIRLEFIGRYAVLDDNNTFFRIRSLGNGKWFIEDLESLPSPPERLTAA